MRLSAPQGILLVRFGGDRFRKRHSPRVDLTRALTFSDAAKVLYAALREAAMPVLIEAFGEHAVADRQDWKPDQLSPPRAGDRTSLLPGLTRRGRLAALSQDGANVCLKAPSAYRENPPTS